MNIIPMHRFVVSAAMAAGLCWITGSAAAGDDWDRLDQSRLKLRSESVLVVDREGRRIVDKNADRAVPIASITKLMTALVVLNAGVDLEQTIAITKADRDTERLTGSRLEYGKARLSRRELVIIALMASENRAAAALGRTTFPGGLPAFVQAMNTTAKKLGMNHSRFADPTGLDADNVASAEDLVKLLQAARGHALIRRATTLTETAVRPYRARGPLRYVNTNRLLKNPAWTIALSKTGYINEAGRCLVMEANLHGRDLYIVLLNSFGKLTPFGDSNRLRNWIDSQLRSG